MNAHLQNSPRKVPPVGPERHLLDTILAMRASVGEGLNDDEFTRLLQKAELPSEAGFGFLSYCEGFLTLSVPPQDPRSWYPEQGWIAPEKEKAAWAIADKYNLSLYEPADTTISAWHRAGSPTMVHHHLQFSNQWETIVVAHPQYLKVRLLGQTPYRGGAHEELCPLTLGAELLRDLSTLYGQAGR